MAQKYRKFMRETKRIIAEQVWRRIKWAVVVDWHTIRVRFEDGKEVLFDLWKYMNIVKSEGSTFWKDMEMVISNNSVYDMTYTSLGVDWNGLDVGLGGLILYYEGEEVVPPHDIADDDEDIDV